MKFLLLFLFIAISLFAQKKWISLKEVKNTKQKADINLSQLQSVNKLLQGAKIIFPLIDKKDNHKKKNLNSKKNWFIIEKPILTK